MILNRHSLTTDAARMEAPPSGLEAFDCVANEGDINGFIGGIIPYHWHREIEFFCLLEGTVRVGIEEQVFILHAGEGCFIGSDVLHAFTSADERVCDYRSFVFDASIVAGTPDSVFDKRYVRPLFDNGSAFIRFTPNCNRSYFEAFNRAFSICEMDAPDFEISLREALSHMLRCTVSCMDSVPSVARMSRTQSLRLHTMMNWIGSHLQEPFKVSDIADSAGICARECQRAFLKYIHCRPMEYVRRQRILASAELILTSGLSFTEIAMRFCFSDSSHFSKSFADIIGVSPSQYKKRSVSSVV